jgi:hypothetical protein
LNKFEIQSGGLEEWANILKSSWQKFVQSLIKEGADVSAVDGYGKSPLLILANYAVRTPSDAAQILKEWLWDIKTLGLILRNMRKVKRL